LPPDPEQVLGMNSEIKDTKTKVNEDDVIATAVVQSVNIVTTEGLSMEPALADDAAPTDDTALTDDATLTALADETDDVALPVVEETSEEQSSNEEVSTELEIPGSSDEVQSTFSKMDVAALSEKAQPDNSSAVSGQKTSKDVDSGSAKTSPPGERWAVADRSTDLSGDWSLIVTDEFKKMYDKYLTDLGQPSLVRSIAVGIVGLTSETITQQNSGRELVIKGNNPRGWWERTLVASGTDENNSDFEPVLVEIDTADSERVMSESWWEKDGTVHKSFLRGIKKYGGGSFESSRYKDGDIYVCDTIFHPIDDSRPEAILTWRFKKG